MDRELQRLVDACRAAADKIEELYNKIQEQQETITDLESQVDNLSGDLSYEISERQRIESELEASR